MTNWLLSMALLAALAGAVLGSGDVLRDRDQTRDQDPIKQQDRLKDGSCQTALSVVPVINSSTIQVS
jgi:catabolite regulation protein CreA